MVIKLKPGAIVFNVIPDHEYIVKKILKMKDGTFKFRIGVPCIYTWITTEQLYDYFDIISSQTIYEVW